jgi:hypothetical protein
MVVIWIFDCRITRECICWGIIGNGRGSWSPRTKRNIWIQGIDGYIMISVGNRIYRSARFFRSHSFIPHRKFFFSQVNFFFVGLLWIHYSFSMASCYNTIFKYAWNENQWKMNSFNTTKSLNRKKTVLFSLKKEKTFEFNCSFLIYSIVISIALISHLSSIGYNASQSNKEASLCCVYLFIEKEKSKATIHYVSAKFILVIESIAYLLCIICFWVHSHLFYCSLIDHCLS